MVDSIISVDYFKKSHFENKISLEKYKNARRLPRNKKIFIFVKIFLFFFFTE